MVRLMTRAPLLALCVLALVTLACVIGPVLPVVTPTGTVEASCTPLVIVVTATPQPVATGAGRIATEPGPTQKGN